MIDIKARRSFCGDGAEMDRFPPAKDGPHYELITLARTMDDLTFAEQTAPRPGGIVEPLICVAVFLVALLAFVGWLLFG